MKQVQWFDQHFYQVLTPEGIEYLPSVTTILNVLPKPYLAKWRGDLGNEEANEQMISARNRGSNIHNAVSKLVKGGVIINSDPCNTDALTDDELHKLLKYRDVYRVYNQFEYLQIYRFLQFMQIVEPEVIFSEETVFCSKYGFAGTLDLLLEIKEGEYKINGSKPLYIKGGYYLADLKTGKTMPEDVWMQLAAYRQGLTHERLSHEDFDADLFGALCIHTNSQTRSNIEGLSVKLRTAEELDKDFEDFKKVLEVWKINPTVSGPKIFTMPAYLQVQKKKKITKPTNILQEVEQ